MFLKIVSLSAVCLLLLGVFLRPQALTRTGLTWLVCLLALTAMVAMVREKRKSWAAAFGVLALLFVPISRLLPNPTPVLFIDSLALVTFMAFMFTQAKPELTIASITSDAERKPSL